MNQNTHNTLSTTQQILISKYLSKTYGWMMVGLLVTGLTSFYISRSESLMQSILGNKFAFYGILIAEFVTVMALSALAQKLSVFALTLGFLFYSFLNGITFSVIFLIYTASSITNVFFLTSAMFGGLALYGLVSKRDMGPIGTFMGMGLWGMIILAVINIFFKSESLSLGISLAGVFIFSGLTAYESQKIKLMAFAASKDGNSEMVEKGSIFSALMMYLNFINLFLSLLRLVGSRRD